MKEKYVNLKFLKFLVKHAALVSSGFSADGTPLQYHYEEYN